MLRHFPRLKTRTNFCCHIDLDTMVCLLQNPAIQATPHQRLEGALQWVRFRQADRCQYLDQLLAQLPSALLEKHVLKGLLRDPMVCCMQRNINAVNDLINSQSRPYHESGTVHALGLSDLRENGGKKVFGFVSAEGAAEFEVIVDASPCMTHFKFTLNCTRVALPESCNRLPDCVRADLKVELCAQDGYRTEMVTVDCGCSEEDCVVLVSQARRVHWSRRFQLNQWQMNQFVASGSKFSLFVHLKALEVNGRREEFDSEESEEDDETREAALAHVCASHACRRDCVWYCGSRDYYCADATPANYRHYDCRRSNSYQRKIRCCKSRRGCRWKC